MRHININQPVRVKINLRMKKEMKIAQYYKLWKRNMVTKFRFDLQEKTSIETRNSIRIWRLWRSGFTKKWDRTGKVSPDYHHFERLLVPLCIRDDLLTESPKGKENTFHVILPKVCTRCPWYPFWRRFCCEQNAYENKRKILPGLHRTDVEKHIKRCDLCVTMKGPKTTCKGTTKQYVTGCSWKRITNEIFGPFPSTALGNRYFLVSMDFV